MQEHDNSKELWQDEQNANNMSDYPILLVIYSGIATALFIYYTPSAFRCGVCTSALKSRPCFQSRLQGGQVGGQADNRLCQAKAMLR